MSFLAFIFVLAPITVMLLIAWWLTNNEVLAKVIGYFWMGLICLFVLGTAYRLLTAQKVLDKEDYYGEYIVDRQYFPGPQANWQYDHFRFEIKANDSIYFYVTDKERILETYRGTISTIKPFTSERLILNMEQPSHHILDSNPTTYRSAWSFRLVFYSPKFHNVCFKKGKWKP